LLDNFRNKFIWHPSSPIFLQVCLLYPGWPILLLPPQQCFGCIWFLLNFFRVFNAFSTSNRPRCYFNLFRHCSLIHYYMPVPCCNTGRFQIIPGSLIVQKVKLFFLEPILERYTIYSLLHIRAATFTALLHLRAGPLSHPLIRLATHWSAQPPAGPLSRALLRLATRWSA
jgi:hypothetical protein